MDTDGLSKGEALESFWALIVHIGRMKVNAVNCVTKDPYCAPHTSYTDDSESEDDYMIMNTRVPL